MSARVSEQQAGPLLQLVAYRHTAVADYVVRRQFTFYADRFVSVSVDAGGVGNDDDGAGGGGGGGVANGGGDASSVSSHHHHHQHQGRVFRLSPGTRLVPPAADAMQRKRRHVRPRGVGSLTALAALRGKGEVVECWCLKVEDPHSGDVRVCFADRSDAARVHALLASSVAALRAAAGGGGSNVGTPRAAAAASAAAAMMAGGGVGTRPSSTGGSQHDLARAMLAGSTFGAPPAVLGGAAAGAGGSSLRGADERADDELQRLTGAAGPLGDTRRPGARRWVPYRHSNGLAIYQHTGGGGGSGGSAGGDDGSSEFMVSAIIRGTPVEVLRALLDPDSPTTIVGPALEVELLGSEPGRQVLRVMLQAVGANSEWFRPREVVLQRFTKKDEDGVYVVLFSPTAEFDAALALRREGVLEVAAEGLGAGARRTHPLRAHVSGGYTISRLARFSGAESPETLLTMVLQVRHLGGWLNPGESRLFRIVNGITGAFEAFLERMLLGVTIVKDVVEKSRFAVKPQVFEAPPSGGYVYPASLADAASALDGGSDAPFSGEAEDDGGGGGAAGGAAAGAFASRAARTSTFVMRQAAAALPGLAGGAARAGAGAGGGGGGGDDDTPFARAGGAGEALSSGASLSRPASRAGGGGSGGVARMSRLASLRLEQGASLGSGGRGSVLQGAVPEEAPAAAASSEAAGGADDAAFLLPKHFYSEIHTVGTPAPFKVRGPTYLDDGRKVTPPGPPLFELLGMEVVDTGRAGPCPHISRYLKSVRRSPKPFLFVYNLMVPGPPTLCCAFVFGADAHPDALGTPPDDPEEPEEGEGWTAADFALYRFLHGSDDERAGMFKMIPHVAEGSWLIKQGVGTTPVIIGRKLAASFHVTEKYAEVAVDVGSSATAAYVTGLVRGGARSLTLDLGLVLEGQLRWELPEALLGAVRVHKLDLKYASPLDDSREVPILRTAAGAAGGGSGAAPSSGGLKAASASVGGALEATREASSEGSATG